MASSIKDLFLINMPALGLPIDPESNDLAIQGNDFVSLNGTDRKRQDIIKILMTLIRSNLIYQNYGSLLPSLVGKRGNTQDPTFQSNISRSVTQALSYVQAMEISTDPSEQIDSIVSLTIAPLQNGSQTDARGVVLNLTILMKDGSTIQTTQNI
jgi:hypothetical protein